MKYKALKAKVEKNISNTFVINVNMQLKIIIFFVFISFLQSTISNAGWIEISPANTCIMQVESEYAIPPTYWSEINLTGYSKDRIYKVVQYFYSYSVSGSIYRSIIPDNEFMCQNHLPNYQTKPCVTPSSSLKCATKEAWPTYFTSTYGGQNAVGTYWSTTFNAIYPTQSIRTYKTTCQNELDALSIKCGGFNNINTFNSDTCEGSCLIDYNMNLGSCTD